MCDVIEIIHISRGYRKGIVVHRLRRVASKLRIILLKPDGVYNEAVM